MVICSASLACYIYRSKYGDLPNRQKRKEIKDNFGNRKNENFEDIQLEILCSQDINHTMKEEIDGNMSNGKTENRTHAMYVSELSERCLNSKSLRKGKAIFQSNDMFIWLVTMMGISYAIPALQLVLKYQEEAEETGNLDICYFNFRCAFPVGKLADFNHFLSNIGYITFGITFLIITKYKSWKFQMNKYANVIETSTGYYLINKVCTFYLLKMLSNLTFREYHNSLEFIMQWE